MLYSGSNKKEYSDDKFKSAKIVSTSAYGKVGTGTVGRSQFDGCAVTATRSSPYVVLSIFNWSPSAISNNDTIRTCSQLEWIFKSKFVSSLDSRS